MFKKNKEKINGIKIYRSPIIPRRSGSNFNLALNYISYVIGSLFKSLFLLNKKIDIIFVHATSPITVCLPAIFIKRIKKIPICLWVLDLWPESMIAAGNLKTNLLPRFINPIVKFIYNNSDKILVSSYGFIDSIASKGIDKSKIEFFPQWAEPIFRPTNKKSQIIKSILNKNSFKIMFAGNIGEAQDFPSILNAAKLLHTKPYVQWIIIGDGRKADWVKEKIIEFGLNDCFHMIGEYPIEKMPEFYSYADAMLFSLKNEYIFSITIPAKVQSYLACGKPILGMVNGESARLINENKVGYASNAGDYASLANNIEKMISLDEQSLNQLSINSMDCYNKNFNREMLLNKVERKLLDLI